MSEAQVQHAPLTTLTAPSPDQPGSDLDQQVHSHAHTHTPMIDMLQGPMTTREHLMQILLAKDWDDMCCHSWRLAAWG
jgi:hypothetical protein